MNRELTKQDITVVECLLQDCNGIFKIESEDILSVDFSKYLSTLNSTTLNKLLKRGKNIYNFKQKCSLCNNSECIPVSKSGLFIELKLLRDGYKFICNACSRKKQIELKQREQQRIYERTLNFISIWLEPKGIILPSDFSWYKFTYCEMDPVNVKKYILAMDYKEFLCTPYWKVISYRVKRNAGFKCQLCNVGGNLNVHHRTYSIHGEEHCNLKELICLCQECHGKHHKK